MEFKIKGSALPHLPLLPKKTLAQAIHVINNAGYFSVSVDSTSDMSHGDQVAVIVI